MSVLATKLKQFQNEEIVVVMADNRAFRGKLVEFDADAMVLNDVVEALPNNAGGWEEPTVSTGIVHKVVTWQGTFSHEENKPELVRLKDVVIQIRHVLRVWEFSMKNLAKPEHLEVQGSPSTQGPASRVSRRL